MRGQKSDEIETIPFITSTADIVQWAIAFVEPKPPVTKSVCERLGMRPFVHDIALEFLNFVDTVAKENEEGADSIKLCITNWLFDPMALATSYFDNKCPFGSDDVKTLSMMGSAFMLHVGSMGLALHACAFADYTHDAIERGIPRERFEPHRSEYCAEAVVLYFEDDFLGALWKDSEHTVASLTERELELWTRTYSSLMGTEPTDQAIR